MQNFQVTRKLRGGMDVPQSRLPSPRSMAPSFAGSWLWACMISAVFFGFGATQGYCLGAAQGYGLLATQELPLGSRRAAPGEIPTVGMTGSIDNVTVSGPELEPKPLAANDKVVVRIAAIQPRGELRQYTLEYWGMEPGQYDLRDYLRVKNAGSRSERVGETQAGADGNRGGAETPGGGSNVQADGLLDHVPPLWVTINSAVTKADGRLNDLEIGSAPGVGGYRMLMLGAIVLWTAVAIAIVLWGRKKRPAKSSQPAARLVTWADHLRPLLKKTQAGELSATEQAALERLLVSFWRDRLGLNDLAAGPALEKVKQDPTAGQLVLRVENWLHSPNPDRSVDWAELLRPYEKEFSAP